MVRIELEIVELKKDSGLCETAIRARRMGCIDNEIARTELVVADMLTKAVRSYAETNPDFLKVKDELSGQTIRDDLSKPSGSDAGKRRDPGDHRE